jgi:hypothetical protein
MPNETRLERATEYCNTKIYGTYPSTKNLADFADQECAALEKENADIKAAIALQCEIIGARDREIESLTKQLAEAREATAELNTVLMRAEALPGDA